jgi:mono/diheme cytochrome c family protein
MLLATAPGGAARADNPLDAAIGRGRAVARQVCARCHAVGPVGDSPDRRAPAFRTLTGQFVPLTLHRRLTEIAETGHYDMPPVAVHSDEVSDLAAYINSFGETWKQDDRPDQRR